MFRINVSKTGIVEVLDLSQNPALAYAVAPGEDYSYRPLEVKNICAKNHTPEVIAAYKELVNPKRTLEELIRFKVSEIKRYYDQLSQTFTYQGHTYQTDVTAKERLMAELQMLSVREDPSPWRDSDNQMVSFSNLEFETFCREVYLYHKNLILTSFSHIDQVRLLQTVEDVNNYDFSWNL